VAGKNYAIRTTQYETMKMKKTARHIDDDNAAQAGLVHTVRRPEGDGPFRTAVLLHGRNGNEEVMWVFAHTLPDDLLLVAPRAIKNGDDGQGYSWHPHDPKTWPTMAEFEEAVAALEKFIAALPDLYEADLSQLYLMGFSQGAALGLSTMMKNPELAQGLAALVGFLPLEHDALVAERPLTERPIFMAAGMEDERIPLNLARRSAKAIRQAGADLTYNEYDTGHRINRQGMRDLSVWWNEQLKA
jgi:phospholipase/carboxylesterase